MVDLEKISEEIKKTGFPLEYKVAKTFEENKWNVISNKYYIDDISNVPREIDLIAYKVSVVDNIDIYTAIIVSCKKSSDKAWALLSKPANLRDPNMDWWPLHVWSNDKITKYEIKLDEVKKKYYDDVISDKVDIVISEPVSDIFAFQEMKLDNGKPSDDKNIYQAINSLIKAQAYEMSVLNDRKNRKSIYQFNLLSVFAGELIKINFQDRGKIDSELVEYEHQFTRYIINKEQIFSRIMFVNSKIIQKVVDDYNCLHSSNCKIFKNIRDSFYSSLNKDNDRLLVLKKDFSRSLYYILTYHDFGDFSLKFLEKDVSLAWNTNRDTIEISIDCDEYISMDEIEKINLDSYVRSRVSDLFKRLYCYDGDFTFVEVIPF